MPLLRGQKPKLIELRDVDETTFSDETPVVKKQTGENTFGGAPAGIGSGGERLEWQQPGAVSSGLKFKKRLHGTRRLLWFKCDSLTAPSAEIVFDVLKNGSSIFTTAPKPTLDTGVTYVEVDAFDDGEDECTDNDVFQLQIVSGAGASDLNVSLYFE